MSGGRRVALGALAVLAVLAPPADAAPILPDGFREQTTLTGMTLPTAVRFAADGRVFVAEKSGLVKVFDGLADETPTVVADLRTQVHNHHDRGLLGLALDPGFPARPYVYVLYTHDAAIGGVAPRWGRAGETFDDCPTPPGSTGDGCVVSGRLSRLQLTGNVAMGPEKVLIEDWCNQYPSHTIGSLAFGADGYLYVSGGDGASFNFADYGQDGSPPNPCGDPPVPAGGTQTAPTAQGGALRSQDARTTADPTGLDGTILRVDPETGAAAPGNPFAASPDANQRRIVGYGLRNPFRITTRPGTSEVWFGEVGWNVWEEVNRIPAPADGTADNFGWPCYEGRSRQPGYDVLNLDICEALYAEGPGAVTPPFHLYSHSAKVVPGETCPTAQGSSAAGLAFYETGPYPDDFDGALVFSDFSRSCIWVMKRTTGALPSPSAITTFVADAAGPVDVQFGPGGEIYYLDIIGGTLRRIFHEAGNRAPVAVATASPRAGAVPLQVQFSAADSRDPEGGALTYAWDLDGDGEYDDSAAERPSFTYTTAGVVTASVRATDAEGSSDRATVTVNAGNTAPRATITTPTAATTWKVGDVIGYSGGATDAEDGPLPAARLSWAVTLRHCPTGEGCHSHPVTGADGVASGSFTTFDHEQPAHFVLSLTATDSRGVQDTASVRIDPRTVLLRVASQPPGMQLSVNGKVAHTPFDTTLVEGAPASVFAPSPQTRNGRAFNFLLWGDLGAQSHTVTVTANRTLTASYACAALSLFCLLDQVSGVRVPSAPLSLPTAAPAAIRAIPAAGAAGTPAPASAPAPVRTPASAPVRRATSPAPRGRAHVHRVCKRQKAGGSRKARARCRRVTHRH